MNPVYEILIERRAESDMKRLPAEQFRRVVAEISALRSNPRPTGCRKIVGADAAWRIRVGEYRVLYEIDDNQRIVRVMRVRHRRDAYR